MGWCRLLCALGVTGCFEDPRAVGETDGSAGELGSETQTTSGTSPSTTGVEGTGGTTTGGTALTGDGTFTGEPPTLDPGDVAGQVLLPELYAAVDATSAGRIGGAGHFTEELNLLGSDLLSEGGADIVLFELQTEEGESRVHQLGADANDWSQHATLDPSGSITMGGFYEAGGTDLDTGLLPPAPDGGSNAFIGRWGADGNPAFVLQIVSDADIDPTAVAVESGGGWVLGGGSHRGTLEVPGEPIHNATTRDAYVAVVDGSGAVRRLQPLFGPGGAGVTALAFGAPGSHGYYAGGFFSRDLNLGATVLSAEDDPAIEYAWLGAFSLDLNGDTPAWTQQIVCDTTARFVGIAPLVEGGVVAVAHFSGAIGFDAQNHSSIDAESDILVTRIAEGGSVRWSKALQGAGFDRIWAIEAGPNDQIALVGQFENELDIDGVVHDSRGGADAFIATFDLDGTLQWSRSFGDEGNDVTYDVAYSGSGDDLELVASITFQSRIEIEEQVHNVESHGTVIATMVP